MTINERADAMFEEWARTPVKASVELFRRHLNEQLGDYAAEVARLKAEIERLKTVANVSRGIA